MSSNSTGLFVDGEGKKDVKWETIVFSGLLVIILFIIILFVCVYYKEHRYDSIRRAIQKETVAATDDDATEMQQQRTFRIDDNNGEEAELEDVDVDTQPLNDPDAVVSIRISPATG